jgi:hypothetical protein
MGPSGPVAGFPLPYIHKLLDMLVCRNSSSGLRKYNLKPSTRKCSIMRKVGTEFFKVFCELAERL